MLSCRRRGREGSYTARVGMQTRGTKCQVQLCTRTSAVTYFTACEGPVIASRPKTLGALASLPRASLYLLFKYTKQETCMPRDFWLLLLAQRKRVLGSVLHFCCPSYRTVCGDPQCHFITSSSRSLHLASIGSMRSAVFRDTKW